MVRSLFLALALLAMPSNSRALEPFSQDRPGDVFDIRVQTSTEAVADDGSSSSQSNFALRERVIAVRDGGVELEFDLPPEATPAERIWQWQYPARVFRSHDAVLRLLNTSELEARLETWLQVTGAPREACGHWIFTWTAFKIECDPQAILQTIEGIDLRPAIQAEQGSRSVLLQDASTIVIEEPIDPEAIRRERMENDAMVREIMDDPNGTDDLAFPDRRAEQISGTIQTTVTVSSDSGVIIRRKVTTVEIRGNDGLERQTVTETVERHALTPRGHDDG